jgi:protein dithiol:quinone oxidoreductase
MTAALIKLLYSRFIWLFIALAAIFLVLGSLVLTVWLDLHPCHLCIFQRILFMLIALLALLAFFVSGVAGRVAGFVNLPIAGLGVGVAAYQTWLQAQPPGSISCVAGEPSLIERLVEWLGQLSPELFLATGFCEEAELSILGLSLAHWSLLSFSVFLLAALWALFHKFAK